jgi:hypothetical protein
MGRGTFALDGIAFDRLTRRLGSSRSRRSALRTALGLVLGGSVIARTSDALADDREDELASEAIAGGRGALDKLGGGSGDARRRRHRKRGTNRDDENRKKKPRDKCARAGELRRDGKPCCKGLYRDSADRCIKSQPTDGSTGICDPNACPSDPATKERGFCCPEGYCSCGGQCCPECGIETINRRGDINAKVVSEREVCCATCIDSGDTCCAGCAVTTGLCIFHTPIGGGSIRRR